MQENPKLSYCANYVRQHDPDRYLSALFIRTEKREAVFAVVAFNIELARIPDTTSEELVAMMRIAWWREALGEIEQGKPVRDHPIAKALAVAMRDHNVSKAKLDILLNARAEDVMGDMFRTLAQWETYAQHTAGTLLDIILDMKGIESREARELASAVAIATGLTGLARSATYHLAHGRVWLPQDSLIEHKIDRDALLESSETYDLMPLVKQLGVRARKYLKQAEALRSVADKERNLLGVEILILEAYLNKIERNKTANKLNFSSFDRLKIIIKIIINQLIKW